ncbi:hypothetical protein K1719_017365 [Acacia pycnantha]|nr:hypothetical protein K1719_017365 [Acacia pycnantha]
MEVDSFLPSSSALSDSRSLTVLDEISEDFAENMMAKLKIDDVVQETEQEQEEEEEEFSFACTIPDESPISADDVFDNGQIRPVYPIFDRSLLFSDAYDGSSTPRPPLKKIFVEERGQFSSSPSSSASESDEPDSTSEGPYCEWSGKVAVEASGAKCDKSNSTGFSKLWRFREAKLRSNSDGKDAFVFLNRSTTNPRSSGVHPEKAVTAKTSSGKEKKVVVRKVMGGNSKTTSSAHEKHYVMNRAKKESDKRKSYLPYKQQMFGIFANANGLSRNVHPF